MLTKNELLEKGVSSEVADEIIASFDENEDAVTALRKAIEDEDCSDLLIKADSDGDDDDGEDDDDDDDDGKDYDEAYMRKNMKKYMIENKKACAKTAKEVGLFGEKMNKAIDDLDTDSEGAVVEMSDLTPILVAQKEFNGEMTKALRAIAGEMAFISNQNEKSFDLLRKSSAVVAEQADVIDALASTPQGRKSVVASPQSIPKHEINKDQSKLIYKTLLKATEAGDRTAGQIISKFEVAGQNVSAFSTEEKKYVNDLIMKEAK